MLENSMLVIIQQSIPNSNTDVKYRLPDVKNRLIGKDPDAEKD